MFLNQGGERNRHQSCGLVSDVFKTGIDSVEIAEKQTVNVVQAVNQFTFWNLQGGVSYRPMARQMPTVHRGHDLLYLFGGM